MAIVATLTTLANSLG